MSEVNDDDVLNSQAGIVWTPDVVSLATVSIWAYLFLHLYVEYAEYLIVLQRSRKWGAPDRFQEVKRQVNCAFYQSLVFAVVIFVGFAILISELTRDMDPRASSIVIGASRLTAGVIFAFLSVNVAQMMGFYYSRKKKVATFTCVREVRFNASWNFWMQIVTMFYLNMFFSCHTERFAVLYGLLVGIGVAGVLIWMVNVARKRENMKCGRRACSIIWIILLLLTSWMCVLIGILYITDVWYPDQNDEEFNATNIAVPTVWALFTVLVHAIVANMTKRQRAKNKTERFTSQVFKQTLAPSALVGAVESTNKTIASMTSSGRKDTSSNETDDDKSPANETPGGSPVTETQESDNRVSFAPVESGGLTKETQNYEGGDTAVVAEGDNDDEDFQEEQGDQNEIAVVQGDKVPSLCSFFLAKVYETYPCCCCLAKYSKTFVPEPRISFLAPQEKSCIWKTWGVGQRVFWYLISLFFLYLTIVNIGATQTQTRVKKVLSPAWDFLYPYNYQNGTMCAWDEASPNADIRSFATLQDVYDANYTVVHCGACGDCSNWNDLSLQWTTRHELAKISKKCAQKSLFGGWDEVQQCNIETIGFLPACSKCWTFDEINTKDNCFWIFLQSIFIDAVGDFRVGYTDITSAACDEALSGPVFVPCSGATRRRMNIISDIPRPNWQQCPVATHNWTEVFNHP